MTHDRRPITGVRVTGKRAKLVRGAPRQELNERTAKRAGKRAEKRGEARAEMRGDKRSDVWLFAYGSLMWERDFPHLEARPALLTGFRRAFCIYSHVYRGTSERPGLVLGLLRGGSCRGIAFRLDAREAELTLRAIDEREMVTGVYAPRFLPVTLLATPATHARRVKAYAFVADPKHTQFAGALPLSRQAELIREAAGSRGTACAYLEDTLKHLRAHGVRDAELERVRSLVLINGS
ncbi:MAG: gamma-glutamylcyclotransferase [Alphaproteobacteria bacterium]